MGTRVGLKDGPEGAGEGAVDGAELNCIGAVVGASVVEDKSGTLDKNKETPVVLVIF